MSLKEMAVKAFEEAEKITKLHEKEEGIKFSKKSIEHIKNTLPIGNREIKIIEAGVDKTIVEIEDLKIKIYDDKYNMTCQLIKKCKACNKEYYISFGDILGLGEAIKNPHNVYYCEKNLRFLPKPTTAERLEKLIMEIVDRNSNDYE